jgi:hypothetical protein
MSEDRGQTTAQGSDFRSLTTESPPGAPRNPSSDSGCRRYFPGFRSMPIRMLLYQYTQYIAIMNLGMEG